MKTIVSLLLILSSFAMAQVDFLHESSNFYPMQIGNYWEYRCNGFHDSIFPDSSAYSVEIVGDTAMPNGLVYRIFRHKYIFPDTFSLNHYERPDSITGCLYLYSYNISSENHEVKIDSLYARPGDTVNCSWEDDLGFPSVKTVCDSITTGSLFGIQSQFRYMHNIYSLIKVDYSLARDFGLRSRYSTFDYGSSGAILAYAKINGVEFGRKIVHMPDSQAAKLRYYPLRTGDYF